jgi:hypothetical protein
VDFSRKRKILKSLTESGKRSFWLFLPCLIAAAFVKLFYNTAMRLDMLFDFNIKKKAKVVKTAVKTPVMPEKQVPSSNGGNISKRPTYARLLSSVLAVCFVFTFLPVAAINAGAAASMQAPFDINGAAEGNGTFTADNYGDYLSILTAENGYPSTDDYEYRTIADSNIQKETVTLDSADTGSGDGKLVISFHKSRPADIAAKLTLPIYTTEITIYNSDRSKVLRTISVSYDPVTGKANDPLIVLSEDERKEKQINYKITNYYRKPIYLITKKQNQVMSTPTDGSDPVVIKDAVAWGIDIYDKPYETSEGVDNGQGSVPQATFNKVQEDVSSISATIDYSDDLYPNGKVTVKWDAANDADGYILHRLNSDTGREEGNPITIKGNLNLQYPPVGSSTVYSVSDKSTVYNFEIIPYKGITTSAASKNPQTETPFFIYGKNAGDIYGTVVSLMESPGKSINFDKAVPISPKGYQIGWNTLPKITNAVEVTENPGATPPKAGYNVYRLPLNNIIASSGSLSASSTHDEIVAYLSSDSFLENDMAVLRATVDDIFTLDNKTNTYSDIEANSGVQYYYAVTAFRTPDTITYESKPLYIPTSTTPRPGVPSDFEVKPASNNMFLKWDAVLTGGTQSAPEYADSYIIHVTLLDQNGNPTSTTGTREVTVDTPSDLRASFVNGKMTTPLSIDYFFQNGVNQVNITNGNNYAVTVSAVDDRVQGSVTSQTKVLVGGTPAQPSNVQVSPSENTITLDWSPVLGADYYTIVYGERDISGVVATWSEPVRVNTNKFVHGNLRNGTTYGYKITACKEVGTGAIADDNLVVDILRSNETPAIYSIAGSNIPAPVNPSFSQSGNVVTISWSAGPVADPTLKLSGYYVNISGSDGTVLQPIPITGLNYKHTINKEDVYYTYSVQAYALISGIPTKSTALEYDEKGYVAPPATTKPATPLDFTATVTSNTSVTLTWTDTKAPSGYIVYGKNGTHTTASSIMSSPDFTSGFISASKKSYIDPSLTAGQTRSYVVTAYQMTGDTYIESTPTVIRTVTTTGKTSGGGNDTFLLPPRDFTVTSGDNSANLTWTAVTGANGYKVHASGPTGTYEFDVTKNSFAHGNLRAGDVWRYYVRAYAVNTEGAFAYSEPSITQSVTIGGTATGSSNLPAPLDFKVVTTDGKATLTWTAVAGAYSYTVHAVSNSKSLSFDVSKPGFEHDRLLNGEEWTYYVDANTLDKTNGSVHAGRRTESITVIIGVTLAQPQDLIAANGNRQIDLIWSPVEGAEGYIVYLYNNALLEFEPIAVLSEPFYSATGLINGTRYSYMVAAYKYINNKQTFSPYSLTAVGVPTTGSPTDLDRLIEVKGALPYGMDHSELVSATANHGAFDEDVDVYVSTKDESTKTVRDTLSGYAGGISSFVVYPFDVSVYYTGTRVEAVPNTGFGVTFTMPLPDELVRYRDYINVLHINDFGEMEILPSTLSQVDDNWVIHFIGTSFSPYAFVIYKDQIVDASSGTFADLTTGTGSLNLGSMLTFTAMFTSTRPTVRKYSRKRTYHIKAIK